MPSLNDNEVKIKVTTKADNKGVDDTAKALNKLNGVFGATGSGLQKLGSMAVSAGKLIVTVGAAAGAAAVAAGADPAMALALFWLC